MNYAEVMEKSFLDELEKIAAAKGRLLSSVKSRLGRRPMRVSTLLRKEKEGTLYKYTGGAKTAGDGSGGNVVPFSNSDAQGTTGLPATAKPGPNDIVPSREDGREAMSTKIPAFARYTLAPAAVNTPEEHGNY